MSTQEQGIMASTPVAASGGNGDERSVRLVNVDADDATQDNTENERNADLYVVTPPAYTQSVAEGETYVDAERVQDEKPIRRPIAAADNNNNLTPASPRPDSNPSAQQEPYRDDPNNPAPPTGSEPQPATTTPNLTPPACPPVLSHYLTEPTTIVKLVGTRACSILPDRPAIWLVKDKKLALSPLAAAVLVKEGLLAPKQLELITQYAAGRRDPTDPLSGIILCTYDTVEEMMLGLVAGPVELGRQSTPMLMQREARENNLSNETSNAMFRKGAGKVALETGKGLGRIVGASLKGPVFIMNGMTRGFHNLPKLYGEEVRDYGNVTGFRSGLVVCGKSLGYGIGDGIIDLFAKPMQGAERNGVAGFATGCAVGIGNAICKPVAGACGLAGYPFVGAYKSIRNNKLWTKDETDPIDLVIKLGGEEYAQATDADRLYVVRVWCQTMMRVRLV